MNVKTGSVRGVGGTDVGGGTGDADSCAALSSGLASCQSTYSLYGRAVAGFPGS